MLLMVPTQPNLEEAMATHCRTLAWRIPWTRGAWWDTVHGVAQSWTRLKQLSTHVTEHLKEGVWGRNVYKYAFCYIFTVTYIKA